MICIDAYRAAIGLWNVTCHCRLLKHLKLFLCVFQHCHTVGNALMLQILISLTVSKYGKNTINMLYLVLLILKCGDIHRNPGPVNENLLTICHINVNSLYVRTDPNPSHKVDEIYSKYCIEKKCSIICVSETWLNPSIPDTNIELPGYDLYRRDRDDGYGGVALYISKMFMSSELLDMRSDIVENIWISLTIGNMKVLTAVFYRPPNSERQHAQNFIEDFQHQIHLAYMKKPHCIFITGDFNDRRYDWTNNHVNSDLKNSFFDLLHSNNFFQVINSPTYFSMRSQPTLLDLFITDSPNLVVHSSVDPPIALCHHCPIYIELNIKHENEDMYSRKIWLYDLGNFDDLNDYILGLPWFSILNEDDDVNTNVENFYKIFTDVCSFFIPNKTVQIRPRDKPWMTGNIRRLLRKRDRYHKHYKNTMSLIYLDLWKNARKQAKSEIKKRKTLYFENIKNKLTDAKIASKTFWKLTKSIMGISKSNEIPCLKDNVGSCYVTSTEKAEHLAEYFASQNQIPYNIMPELPQLYYLTNARLSHIEIKPEVVYKTLLSLDTSKACGPDNVGNKVLKNCALSLVDPLCKIFQKSLCDGVFPTVWKDANLSALYKGKEHYSRCNYRPISLLSCISKCLERCVFIELYKFCVVNQLLTWKNSGFKHIDSTILQLISLVQTMYENLDKGKNITIIFLDVSKAFDRVWQEGLIFKLKTFGICGNLLKWFESYLCNRRQRVIVKGKCSKWYHTNAGVPQGSILGPLLFLIFINDIVNHVKCDIRLFADDTCIFDINENTDLSIYNLNNDLASLHKWSKDWCVTFNPSKTVYMHLTRKNEILPLPPLYFENNVLKRVSNHKHLGIIINEKLNWDSHISYVIEKISLRLNSMRRAQILLPRHCLETVYKCMILPIIDYGDVLYPELSKSQLCRLVNIQRQAALICTKAYQRTPNTLLLNELGWEDLSIRRRYHSLTIMFKILNNMAPDYLIQMCPSVRSNSVPYVLRNENKLSIFHCKYSNYRRSFFPVAVNLWNELEKDIILCNSLSGFKCLLKKQMFKNVNKLFSLSNGRAAVQHTRLRLGLSGLNSHRFMFHFIAHSYCPKCGFENENIEHYFFYCPWYAAQRETLYNTLDVIYVDHVKPHRQLSTRTFVNKCVKILLNGDCLLKFPENQAIFSAIHKYIKETKRFL
jgi:exonuclease III